MCKNFRDLVDEALTFHLIPERRALIQSFRTEPRVSDVKGYIFVVGGLNRHGECCLPMKYFCFNFYSYFIIILPKLYICNYQHLMELMIFIWLKKIYNRINKNM